MLSTSGPISGDQVQSWRPERASRALTVLGGSVTYRMPSTAMGVVSMIPPSIW